MGSLHYWILFLLFLCLSVLLWEDLIGIWTNSKWFSCVFHVKTRQACPILADGACTQPVICRDRGARLLVYSFFALLFYFIFDAKKDKFSELQSWDIWQKSKVYWVKRTWQYSLMYLILNLIVVVVSSLFYSFGPHSRPRNRPLFLNHLVLNLLNHLDLVSDQPARSHWPTRRK